MMTLMTMMTSSALDSTRARRYLLGQSSDEECAVIEEALLADDAVVDRISAAEESLIEGYLHGELSTDDRARFERVFLASPKHRLRVETVRQLARRAAEAPARAAAPERRRGWSPTRLTLWTPWMALAASTLVAAGATLLWTQRTTPVTQVATAPPIAAAPDGGTPASGAVTVPAAVTPRLFAVTLMPVAVRSAGASVVASLPAGTDVLAVRLEQDVDTRRLVASQVVVRSVDGREIWRGPARDARGRSAAAVADVDIPVAVLPGDDYLITLYGRDPNGVEQDWMQYFLRVAHQ